MNDFEQERRAAGFHVIPEVALHYARQQPHREEVECEPDHYDHLVDDLVRSIDAGTLPAVDARAWRTRTPWVRPAKDAGMLLAGLYLHRDAVNAMMAARGSDLEPMRAVAPEPETSPAGTVSRRGLSTSKLAQAFAGLPWSEVEWMTKISQGVTDKRSSWLQPARIRHGTAGNSGAEAEWCPLSVGRALLGGGFRLPAPAKALTIKRISSTFNMVPLLRDWREDWAAYAKDVQGEA